jgi:mannose-6-phosphate isomerase class I
VYQTPAREFELGFLEPSKDNPVTAPAERGVDILLGLEGQPVLRAGAALQPLGRGRCLVAPAALGGYTIEGDGRVARARVPA